MVYGASGFASLTDEAGVYLPTGQGDAQRMELLNMLGDGSDVWLDSVEELPGRRSYCLVMPAPASGRRRITI